MSDLEAVAFQPCFECSDAVGEGLRESVELVEDGAGQVVVDGAVPEHLVTDAK
jgi:hypothetical protein